MRELAPVNTERPDPRFDGKIIRGKEGWLFLDSDTNSVMLQHAGTLRFTPHQLNDWRFLLETRIAWLEKRGIRYFFLVPPNPHSVYSEFLPDGSGRGEDRPILQLWEHLSDSYARIIYPIEQLVAEKSRCIYNQTGSHWNDVGAFIGYRRLMAEMGVATRILTEEDLHVFEVSRPGELGVKLDPPVSSPQVHADIRDSRAQIVSDNRIENTGRRVEYQCDELRPTSCLVFGDSFAHMLLPFLAESFGRLVFAQMSTLDYDLVEHEKPDVVLSVMNERFLINVPVDGGAPTLEQHAARKRAAGLVYRPRTTPGTRITNT